MNLLKLAVAGAVLAGLVVLMRRARRKPSARGVRRSEVPWGDDV